MREGSPYASRFVIDVTNQSTYVSAVVVDGDDGRIPPKDDGWWVKAEMDDKDPTTTESTSTVVVRDMMMLVEECWLVCWLQYRHGSVCACVGVGRIMNPRPTFPATRGNFSKTSKDPIKTQMTLARSRRSRAVAAMTNVTYWRTDGSALGTRDGRACSRYGIYTCTSLPIGR